MLRDERIPIGKRFNLFLSAVSFLKFLLIFLSSFFGNSIEIYSENIIMIILGIFLANQGQMFQWPAYFKDKKLSQSEFLRVIVGIFGLVALIIGILGFAIPPSESFTGMKGILAGIAMVMIFIQSIVFHRN